MFLYDKVELLEKEKKIRLTYSINDTTTCILVVGIEELFEQLVMENKVNLLSEILSYNRLYLN